METGLRILLLSALLALSGCASVRDWLDRDEPPPPPPQPTDQQLAELERQDTVEAPPRVIEPEVERRQIKIPKIDTENVEVGAYFGALSIEDFGTNPVYGASAAYHVSEDFFFQGEIGRSTAGRTSFETLGGNITLLNGDDRRFTYYNLSLGYNFLPGEVFLGRGQVLTSTFYLMAGIGAVEFGGDQKATFTFGGGYKVLPTDWLSVNLTVVDRAFDSDLLGTSKVTNNIQAHIGATVFF